jgi:hypothetical protein
LTGRPWRFRFRLGRRVSANSKGRFPRGIAITFVLALMFEMGCSPFFVQSERPCTTSRAAPWYDTGVAAVAAVGTVAATASAVVEGRAHGDTSLYPGPVGQIFLVILLVPVAIAYGISAKWGHSTVSKCIAHNHLEEP